MALSNEDLKKYVKRLLLSRMRILNNQGFYGLLLMHLTYSMDEGCETAYTDGTRIAFSPKFMDGLTDDELDFVLMHEILHVALQHCSRTGDKDPFLFNIACDIVVNSNILKSNGNDLSTITLQEYGESMHLTPDGREGYNYTAEEVYQMLLKEAKRSGGGGGEDSNDGGSGGSKSGLGDGNGSKQGGKSGSKSGRSSVNGGAGASTVGSGATSVAAASSVRAGSVSSGKAGQQTAAGEGEEDGGSFGNSFDDHSKWKKCEEDESFGDTWTERVRTAAEAISIRDPSNQRGLLPLCAERLIKEWKAAQTDWRTILQSFVQEEINDYSFSPPDRRFDDNPFFLPDFNEKEDVLEDVLFMIDTSGSMSDGMITTAYSEVRGALEQFGGKLKGWLGFFDGVVVEPKPFENEDELKIIRPYGGGGTSFHIIFKYVQEKMTEKPPACIIILTDGYAPFPKEKEAMDIPVLWIINNEEITPPWGRIARIKE